MTKQDAEAKLIEARQLLERAQAALAHAVMAVARAEGTMLAFPDPPAPPPTLGVKGRKRGV